MSTSLYLTKLVDTLIAKRAHANIALPNLSEANTDEDPLTSTAA